MSKPERPYRANPLAAWFLLTAICAVLLALIVASAVSTGRLVVTPIAGFLSLLMGVAGLFTRPRLPFCIMGIVAGGFVGIAAGFLISCSPPMLTSVSFAVLSGSIVIAIIGCLNRADR